MKRKGFIYDSIYTMENLRLAHSKARKDKAFYEEVKMVDANEDYYLRQIQEMLKNKIYSVSQEDYTMFEKNDKGKIRQIYKLDYYPHRIVQHALLVKIEHIYMHNYIDNTFSSIPNRGIHKALSKLNDDLRNDVENTQYCLKMDVRKFYPSINHEVNKKMYRRKFKDNDLLWLIDMLIDSMEGTHGIAIGSLFSQFDGNFFLSPLDHWLKEEKKVKYLYRYCDDIVILGKSKEELHELRKEIETYLRDELDLELKDNWQVFSVEERGIDYVGYRHFRNYILLRKTTSEKLTKEMRRLIKKCESGGTLTYPEYCSISSYKGWMKWADCHNLYLKWIKPLEPYRKEYYEKEILPNKKEKNIKAIK